MNFQDVAARFEQTGSGSDAFKLLSRDAFNLMKTDPANAGLYFVIGVAAKSYVHRYEDQGVTAEFSDRAKDVLVGYNRKLVEGLSADPAIRLRLLGEVAMDYEWNVTDF